ncbi:hypothetical protein CQW23_27167 [Capsicum baccatum]|uniref:Uncharacterized protein n=1 Tax=Capsicum baccatum TaxID=33114 RepID=A0A2G2VCW6_CAPBA|nr:hypothetical protein CQW23_27167 [Capsicum baccatum]
MGTEIEKLKTNEDKLKSIAINQLTQQCAELCRSEDIKVPELEGDFGTFHKTHNIYQSTYAGLNSWPWISSFMIGVTLPLAPAIGIWASTKGARQVYKTNWRSDKLAGGFDVAVIFPSYKFLHSLSKTKKKLLDVHCQVDSIVEDIINERKKNHKGDHALGDEDLIDVLLRVKKDRSLEFSITNNNIKAIINDMFGAGTETSSTATVWAMAEMMKNPSVFAKLKKKCEKPLGTVQHSM